MQVEVIPAFRLPRSKVSFTYSIPKEFEGNISIGMIVEIPWRKSSKQGIISKIHQKEAYAGAKEILQILETTPSFTQEKIAALEKLAQYYFTAPSTLLMLFLPDVPKRKREVSRSNSQHILPDLTVTKDAIETSTRLIESKNASEVVKIQTESERFFFYRQVIAKQKKAIIICPTYYEAEQLQQYLASQFTKTLLWDNRLGKNQLWQDWQKCKSNEIDVVIGTSSALFVPVEDCIYLLDQQDRSEHKQFDGSPYLDSREAVRIIAIEHGSKLFETAFVPQITEEKFTQLSTKSTAPIVVKHRDKKSLFVPDIDDLFSKISQNQKAFIILPSFGKASALYCIDCERTWRCPTCKTKLRVDTDRLSCLICAKAYQLPMECNGCYGQNITSVGIGLEGMKTQLESRYQVQVGRFTASIQEDLDAEVILLTPYQLKQCIEATKKPDIVLLYHPEQLLYSPDHNAQWSLYALLNWHRAMVETYTTTSLLIQTDLDISHRLFQLFVQDGYTRFSQQELAQRKQFLYPPYSDFIAISSETALSLPTEYLGPFIGKKKSYRYVLKALKGGNHTLDKTLGSNYNKVKIDRNPDRLIFIPHQEHA